MARYLQDSEKGGYCEKRMEICLEALKESKEIKDSRKTSRTAGQADFEVSMLNEDKVKVEVKFRTDSDVSKYDRHKFFRDVTQNDVVGGVIVLIQGEEVGWNAPRLGYEEGVRYTVSLTKGDGRYKKRKVDVARETKNVKQDRRKAQRRINN